MKKIIILLLISSIFCGCGSIEPYDSRLSVYTSFYAVYDFARQIGGDRVNVKCMVPNGAEPHDYEPSVRVMAGLEGADIFIYNGLGMESFAESIKESVEGDILFVEASQGCDVLYGYEEEHDEDEDGHSGHDGTADPHVWLSPANAVIEAENICSAFCTKDPENSDYYKKNLEIFRRKAEELDNEYKKCLSPFRGESIIVSHGAYGYLCGRYGLLQSAAEGMGGSGDPSPRRIRDIYRYIKENNITCIFYEGLTGSRTAAAISEDLGIRLYPIYSYEGLTEEQEKKGLDYFGVMHETLVSLTEGLEGEK